MSKTIELDAQTIADLVIAGYTKDFGRMRDLQNELVVLRSDVLRDLEDLQHELVVLRSDVLSDLEDLQHQISHIHSDPLGRIES